VRHLRQHDETDGNQHGAGAHDEAAAAKVDQVADPGGGGTGHQQPDGEAAEYEALAPAGVGGDRLA
jgi:hypothetical protein